MTDARIEAPAESPSGARRRRAVVLFAHLAGSSALQERLGTERGYAVITECLRELEQVARHHGAAVDKYLGDSMMAVFGHPIPTPQPSAAALAAASEMRDCARHLGAELAGGEGLDLRVGIDEGSLLFGDLGSGGVRREFHVVGDPVVVAARLQQRASPGEVWVTAAVRDGAGTGFRFAPARTLDLKGKRRQVECALLLAGDVSRVESAFGPDEGDGLPLLGRDEERAVLGRALHDLVRGRSSALAILGPPGSGKTRLIEDTLASPAARGLPVWRRRASRAPRPGGLLGLAPRPRDRGRVRLRAPGDAPAAPDALGARLAGDEGPLVVVLEDLQWIDEPSRERLRSHLATDSGRPVLTLLSASEGPGGAPCWLAEAGIPTLSLPPLADEDARALLARARPDVEMEPEDVADCLARAGGSPAQLVRAARLLEALRIERAQGAALAERSREAERRRCSVLFADLSGFTALTESAGPERTYELVRGALEILGDCARDYGGHVEKHLGDCVIATFGLPIAQEEAARAAVNAAIEMRARLRAFVAERAPGRGLDVHTGIATGRAVSGDVSGSLLREFAVLGDSMDEASRLCDEARSGQILVSPGTREDTREVFEYRGRPGCFLLLSGSVQLYREAPSRPGLREAPLVGREDERAALASAVAGVAAGRGRRVALRGEAGLGKTRLVAESLRLAREAGVDAFVGRSVAARTSHGYHVVADLASALLGGDLEPGSGEAGDFAAALRVRVDERVSPERDGASIAEPLRRLLEGGREDGSVEGLDRLLLRALSLLLGDLARRSPCWIVLEDLHWADASSLALLGELAEALRHEPVGWLWVTRPTARPDVREQIEADPEDDDAVRIEVEALDSRALEALIEGLFGTRDVPARIRRHIAEKSGGNPLFVNELVAALLDSGHLRIDDDGLELGGDLEGVELPGSLEEVVLSRVDARPRRERELLRDSAVLGQRLEPAWIRILASDPDRLEEDLDALVGARLLERDERGGPTLEFAHPLIQEVCYAALVEDRRRDLHGRVARAIEDRAAEAARGRSGLLAYHFSRAGDVARAETWLQRAGDEAAGQAASREAQDLFEQALSLYDTLHPDGGDPRRRSLLESKLATAKLQQGQLAESVVHYDEALRLVGLPPARTRAGLVAQGLRSGLSAALRLTLSRSPGGRVPSEREQRAIELMFGRSQALITTDPVRFVVDTLDNLRRLLLVDPRRVDHAGKMYAAAVGTFAFGGVSFALSRRVLERAAPLVTPESPADHLFYRVMRFLHALLSGEADPHADVDERTLRDGLDRGLLWEVTNYLDLDAHRQLHRGDFHRVRQRLDWLGEIAELYRFELARAALHAHASFLALSRRDLPAALEAAETYARAFDDPTFRLVAFSSLARARTLAGDRSAAQEALARAGQAAGSGRPLPFHAVHWRAAEARLALAEIEEGAQRDRSALQRARRRSWRYVKTADKVAPQRSEALRLWGRTEWLCGHRGRATRIWAGVAERAGPMGARPERARTWAEAAIRVLEREGPESKLGDERADAWLERGRAELAELGLEWDLEQVDRRVPGRL